MPKIYRKTHQWKPPEEEDIEVKSGKFRVYFQNKYSIISLVNDILTGLVYVTGSILTILDFPAVYSNYLWLAGGIFLTSRPIIKIVHNVYIHKDNNATLKQELNQENKEFHLNKEEKDSKQDNDETDPKPNPDGESYNDEYYDQGDRK